MEFRNEIDRWRQIKEFAEYVMKYADYHEMKAIRKCVHYEWAPNIESIILAQQGVVIQ